MKTKFAVITNRGAQVALESSREAANKIADKFTRGDVFAWVIEADESASHDDMPGRGRVYG